VDFAAAKLVLEAFEREGVRDAVFGAAALDLHGRSPRAAEPVLDDPRGAKPRTTR
jgi:hypothetical protein